jgi:arylsulfatase
MLTSRHPGIVTAAVLTLFAAVASAPAQERAAADKPNIVLMFPDNLGWGEVGVYGSVRGAPTPNIDSIAAEGLRLNNFNVEYSCTVSRVALLTGRYAARAGAQQANGMTLWEVTMAEALRSQGYATALFGKWHVGGDNWEGSREPRHQGFDEWYGIPGTSHVSQFTSFEDFDPTRQEIPFIWEARGDVAARKVKEFNLETRRTIDREAAERGVDFMKRQVAAGKPFFFYYPMTQIHFPTLAHPDFAGKTGAGDIGDAMADVDYNVGLVLKAIDDLGVRDSTIVIWCTDNGAESRRPWRGSSGPWRGFYNTAMEGGIRTPFVMRWPGRIPAGRVSNEIVHQMDLFPTFAAAIGAPGIVPTDRPIDGVNQLDFLTGRQERSNRESVLYMAQGGAIQAVKWRDWKFWFSYRAEAGEPASDSPLRLFNLRSDPKEETDVKDFNPWVMSVVDKIVADYNASVEAFPNVPRNARDPYVPPDRER